jgi:hypothetical protein
MTFLNADICNESPFEKKDNLPPLMSISDVVKLLWNISEVSRNGWIAEDCISYLGKISIPRLVELKRGDLPEFNWLMARSKDKSAIGLNVDAIYPEPQHALDFFNCDLERGGYKEFLPGAVCAIGYMTEPGWRILDLQNLYKLPFKEELVEHYRIARNILCEHFFSNATDAGVFQVEYVASGEKAKNLVAKQDKIMTIGKRYGFHYDSIAYSATFQQRH